MKKFGLTAKLLKGYLKFFDDNDIIYLELIRNPKGKEFRKNIDVLEMSSSKKQVVMLIQKVDVKKK